MRLPLQVAPVILVHQLLHSVVNGGAFMPTIHTRCINGLMSITLQTNEPFTGVTYVKGYREHCQVHGTDDTHTTINIPLTDVERCGVQYDQDTEQYWVLLEVRQHYMIILDEDRTFNVSCPTPSAKNGIQNNEGSAAGLMIGLFDGLNKKTHDTVLGDNYTIRVWSTEDEDFMVTACMAFAGYNYSLQLTDYFGCSRDYTILTDFTLTERVDRASVANLRSMFKFPKHQTVHIQCGVLPCDPIAGCNRVDCHRRRDAPFPMFDDEGNLTRKLSDIQLEFFTSTTVKIADVGNRTRVQHLSSCEEPQNILLALVILFGFLFLASVAINIICCTLFGTCCSGGGHKTSRSYSDKSVEDVVTDAKKIDAMHSQVLRQSKSSRVAPSQQIWGSHMHPTFWYPHAYMDGKNAVFRADSGRVMNNYSPVSYYSADSGHSANRLIGAAKDKNNLTRTMQRYDGRGL